MWFKKGKKKAPPAMPVEQFKNTYKLPIYPFENCCF
jgi:hypothetical protein